MRRSLKVIVYDIGDYKRLFKVSSMLMNFGSRIQKSVFECYLDDTQELSKEVIK